MLEGIKINCHSSIRINKDNKIIYIDPFRIKENYKDADIVLITHSHYDHFSEEDIKKVIKQNTKILTAEETYKSTVKLGIKEENIVVVKPFNEYNVNDIKIETIPSYNVNKKFHEKDNGWVGYIINLNNEKYYIMGDTDYIEEHKKIKCDVLFIPIGGTYTMNVEEAVECVNTIRPRIVVPIHYGEIVGKHEDANRFEKMINNVFDVEILIEE